MGKRSYCRINGEGVKILSGNSVQIINNSMLTYEGLNELLKFLSQNCSFFGFLSLVKKSGKKDK
jgi:hypothetical protein